MKMKAIVSILAGISLYWFFLCFAEVGAQGQIVPQQKPAERVTSQTSTAQPIPEKLPSINRNMLQTLQTTPSRATLINALMSNLATRTTLESLAKSAKIQVADLHTKGLDGMKIVSAVSAAMQIEALNWNGGIKFSLTQNVPKFFDPTGNLIRSLAKLWLTDVYLGTDYGSQLIQSDIFPIDDNGRIAFKCFLPQNTAAYMIAIKVSRAGKYVPEIHVYDRYANTRRLDVIPLSTGDGYVGIITIYPRPCSYLPHLYECYLDIRIPEHLAFASITMTRL